MRITIKDIADHAQVSTATVSRALNLEQSGIKSEVRERIIALAKSMGYIKKFPHRPHMEGEETIGVIYKRSDNNSSAILNDRLFHGIEMALYSHKQQIMLHNLALTDTIPAFLQNNLVSSVLLVELDIPHNHKLLRYIKNHDITAVSINPAQDFQGIQKIQPDYQRGFGNLTDRLFSHGCRHVAFVSNDYKHYVTESCFFGYLRSLFNHGYDYGEAIWLTEPAGPGIGEKIAEDIIASRRIDGIICIDYYIAQKVISSLQKRGVRVPKDVKVCGFDPDAVQERIYDITSGVLDFNVLAEGAVSALLARDSVFQSAQESIFCQCGLHEGVMD